MWPAPTFLDACASKLLYIISFNSFRAGLFKERIVYLPYSCLEGQQYIFSVTKEIFQNTIKIWKFKILRHNILLYWDFR